MTNSSKPPVWFWVVGALALIWNLLGVMAYLQQAFMSEEALNALPADELELLNNTPAWATAAFAIAVWFGFLGTFLLLLRRGLAYVILIISFIGIMIQMFYAFFLSNSIEVYGPGGMIMPIMVIIIAIALIFMAKKGKAAGWLS